ncbi:MAG: hypothetical protein Q8O64_05890 [Sideroxyarcus sp.]|nr:hypothetical protein [Sideroxyarcus sp.]
MAKIIIKDELAQIVTKLLTTSEIDDAVQFSRFMTDMAKVVADHCGGEVSPATYFDGVWAVAVEPNDSLPADGGVWKDYDTDVAFVEGEEVLGEPQALIAG